MGISYVRHRARGHRGRMRVQRRHRAIVNGRHHRRRAERHSRSIGGIHAHRPSWRPSWSRPSASRFWAWVPLRSAAAPALPTSEIATEPAAGHHRWFRAVPGAGERAEPSSFRCCSAWIIRYACAVVCGGGRLQRLQNAGSCSHCRSSYRSRQSSAWAPSSVTPVFLVSPTETIGDTSARPWQKSTARVKEKELSGSIACDGFVSSLSACFGCLPITSFSQNVGLVAADEGGEPRPSPRRGHHDPWRRSCR